MNKTYKIIYRSMGRSFEISPDSPAKLLENGLLGFDCTSFDVKISSYATLDGGYASRRRFAERELSLTFEIDAKSADTMRREIISILDPRVDGELDVTLCGVNRKISVIPCGEPKFTRPTVNSPVIVTLDFIAPSVFFYDSSKKAYSYYYSMPLLTFPMNFIEDAGLTTGLDVKTDTRETINNGDAECGIIAKIVSCGGKIVNPEIRCGDKFVRCLVTLFDGDVLVISTVKGQKNIYLNGRRHFNFHRNSTFFSLPVGVSSVTVSAEAGEEYIDAEIEYTPLYFGV